MAYRSGLETAPVTVAELGPGDSVGVGLAALLSGSERYRALDVVSYATPKRNLEVFEELVDLFKQRAPIPDEEELAEVRPALDSYDFPSEVLTDQRLAAALASARLDRLRNAILTLGSASEDEEAPLSYIVSWQDAARIRPGSVSAIFSQAVLEHVEDLQSTYRAMHAWLKAGAWMSHQIDFRSHGATKAWNGHWAVSELAWKVMRGRKAYSLNREPCSRHIAVLSGLDFAVVRALREVDTSGITRGSLVPRFRSLSNDDLSTCGLFVQAVKRP